MKILLLALVAAAALTTTGCSSHCGSNCPITTVRITAEVNLDLPIRDVAWVGPACPPFLPTCRGDELTGTYCTHLDVPGRTEGICDVMIAFTDRPSMAIRTQFGPAVSQGCCGGFPVVGDSVFTIPVASDAGIYGGDGSRDAVTLITDAGTTDAGAGDGGTDATSDAAAD